MGPQRMFGMTPWVRRLLVACLFVFLLQSTLFTSPAFVQQFGFNPLNALAHPWTLLTYMFLHGGVLHLAFNMLMLYMFGPSVEERMGGRDFLVYYLLCGFGAAKLLVTFALVVSLLLAWRASDGVAHLAHLGGFAAGFIYLKTQDWRGRPS